LKRWHRVLAITVVASAVLAILFLAEVWSLATEGQPQSAAHPQNQYQPIYALTVQFLLGLWGWLGKRVDHDTISTLAIVATAVFTGTLWWSTKRLWESSETSAGHLERSLSITDRAASAAQKSADVAERALFTIERPRLFVGSLRGYWDYPRTEGAPEPDDPVSGYKVFYRIANYGRTPAILVRMNWTIALHEGFEERLNFSKVTSLHGDIVAHNKKGKLRRAEFTRGDGWPTTRPMRGETATPMIVFGFIIYDDIWGNQYRREHCFLFMNDDPRDALIYGGDKYNKETQQRLVVYDKPPDDRC
jgi:hypothetical protein